MAYFLQLGHTTRGLKRHEPKQKALVIFKGCVKILRHLFFLSFKFEPQRTGLMKRYMKCEVLDIPEIANAFCLGSCHFNPLIQTARKQYGHDGMRIDSKAVNSPRNVKLSADVAPVTCVSYALRRRGGKWRGRKKRRRRWPPQSDVL